ncbi:alpha-D-ribose 1-methylphosphonate 5-triphosphate synthase subunit PhnG [Bradyrhizobium sp. USDA 4369]
MTRPRTIAGWEHGAALSIVARARPDRLAVLAEAVLLELEPLDVLESRTGLVLLPMTDTVRGTDFHLGEVLVAEARIRRAGARDEFEGYGLVIGRDLEHAMAMAVVDLAGALEVRSEQIAVFLEAEKAEQTKADREAMRKVAATRVAMETF